MDNQKIVEFNESTSKKVFNALKKFKDPVVKLDTIQQVIKEGLEMTGEATTPSFFMDDMSVVYIEAISNEAKLILNQFIDKETEYPIKLIQDLKSQTNPKPILNTSFSSEYLKNIFDLFYTFESSVKIYIDNDKPALFENQHFRVLLAPRIENYGGKI